MDVVIFVLLFIFFKQKTAYEMRISDWSSDVCSSDLTHGDVPFLLPRIITPGESMPSSDLGEVGTCRPAGKGRSEEHRVGTECVRTCRFRRSPYPYNKTAVQSAMTQQIKHNTPNTCQSS